MSANSRTTEELLTFVFDSINKIAGLRSRDRLLPELAKMARDIVYADRCTIWILNRRKKRLWTKVAQDVEPFEMSADMGLVGCGIEENRSLIINDVQNDSRFNSDIDKETGYTTKSMIVIPMENKGGQVIGALQVINKKNGTLFSDTDLTHLKLASSYASETLTTILAMEEIEQTQRELINIMGVTGENRSKETGFHVKRVAEYSWLLGKLYGLSEKECDILKDVSPMHDIGKIGIPDAILNKPGRLDDDEMTIMKTHASLGYEILRYSDLMLLKSASIVAHEHHEKWDGSGYPRGLKGEEIHIYGRITALADVFDALGSDRVYKKAWDDTRIFALFNAERGKHFDPKLIDLFMEHVEKFHAIRNEFKDEF